MKKKFRQLNNEKLIGNPKESGRYTKLGKINERGEDVYRLVDKIIYTIDVCPFCNKTNTFHKRMMDGGCRIGNVWRMDKVDCDSYYVLKKFDFCFNCVKEFIIEIYCWEKLSGSVK